MSWILEPSPSSNFNLFSASKNFKNTGNGFLLPSLDLIPEGFEGKIWQNTVFTVPHDDEIGAASVVTSEDPNWGANDLLVEKLWGLGARGARTKVGVADSGVDPNHHCFSHLNISSDNFAAFNLNDGELISDTPSDSGWHGTHCAGVIFGREQTDIPRGIAPLATPCIARVLDGWNGSVASIKQGLDWLRHQKCDVVSLSLGWPGLHDEWATEIQNLIDDGTIVIAATGNEYGIGNTPPTRSPGNYPIPNLISVGAYDITRTIWSRSGGGALEWPEGSIFSGFDSYVTPHLVGPGVEIVSCSPNSNYRIADGTSMATPQIAGIIACLLSYLIDKRVPSPHEVAIEILFQSLVDLGDVGKDTRYGNGAVDSQKLVDTLMSV